MWWEEIKKFFEFYGFLVNMERGVYIELIDDEGEVYDWLVFYVENFEEEWFFVKVFVEVIVDLIDYDILGRNVFVFGFRFDFGGIVIKLFFFDVEVGKGVVIGEVLERILKIVEKNVILILWVEGDGIGFLREYIGEDFEVFVKFVEVVIFEW